MSLKLYPLSSSAFWRWGMASSKTCWLNEMHDSLLLMFSGMYFSKTGEWLLWRWT